jgi:hypothetical protein
VRILCRLILSIGRNRTPITSANSNFLSEQISTGHHHRSNEQIA